MRTSGEQGLLSIAFSPAYATDHTFYAFYVSKKKLVTISQFVLLKKSKGKTGKNGKDGDGKGGGRSVGRFKETVLLTVNHSKFDNHNGGELAFGPDGKLYAGIGDGGGGGDPLHSGQTPTSNLGKLLRAAGPTFKTWQVAGYGLRNPWRYSFDSATGDLYIGDVGQGSREEVDYRAAADSRDAGELRVEPVRGHPGLRHRHPPRSGGLARHAARLPGPGVRPLERRLLDHRRLRLPRQRDGGRGRALLLRRSLLRDESGAWPRAAATTASKPSP